MQISSVRNFGQLEIKWKEVVEFGSFGSMLNRLERTYESLKTWQKTDTLWDRVKFWVALWLVRETEFRNSMFSDLPRD